MVYGQSYIMYNIIYQIIFIEQLQKRLLISLIDKNYLVALSACTNISSFIQIIYCMHCRVMLFLMGALLAAECEMY